MPSTHPAGNARFAAYNARYPAASVSGGAPTDFSPVVLGGGKKSKGAARPLTNMYHAHKLPGVTAIFITSYIPGDNFASTSPQYQWLEAQLKAVDRAVTPWVIVTMHSPWYTSYVGAFCFSNCFLEHALYLFPSLSLHATTRTCTRTQAHSQSTHHRRSSTTTKQTTKQATSRRTTP